MNKPYQQENTVPPFLKEFNPFAVLKPERVEGNWALTDKHRKTDTEQKLSGSFITTKRDADVLDVFDNFFVTPNQLSCKGTSNDVEFSKFLDKYEPEKVGKLIDIPETNESKRVKYILYPDDNIKVLEPKLDVIEDNEALIDELLLEKTMESMFLKEISVNSYVSNSTSNVERENYPKNCYVKDNPNDVEDFRKIKNETPSKNQSLAKQNAPKHLPTNTYNCNVLIEAVSKAPKVFQKRRIVKPEAETSKYTTGANLYEKSVVLPQIMQRLTKRKVACDLKKNMTKKLLLDTAKSVAVPSCNYSGALRAPNKVNLTFARDKQTKIDDTNAKSLKTGELNVNFGKPSSSKVITDAHNKPKNVLVGSPSGFNEELERNILAAMIFNKHNDINGDLKVIKGQNSTGGVANTKRKDGVFSPEVLMEDCNKQRLIEFERRRLFDKFVRTGKI